jgi:RNA polymerase sigma factor (sigma-70 family)
VAAPPDDDALLAGMALGDTGAAEVFVRRHAERVTGVALAVVGDRQVAEDVAQEVFWRAWRAAANFDARRGTGEAWLLTIARNAAIDYVRVTRPQPVDPQVLVSLVGDDRGRDGAPGDDLVAEAEATEVRAALRVLPDDQRRALLMAAVGGRTAAEVGAAEGIPLGTAKTRIRTALRRLREALQEDARREV